MKDDKQLINFFPSRKEATDDIYQLRSELCFKHLFSEQFVWNLRVCFLRNIGFNMGLNLQGNQEKSLKSITYVGKGHKPNNKTFLHLGSCNFLLL